MLVLVLVGNTLAQEHVSSILLNYQHAAQRTAFALVSVRIVAGAARGFRGIGGRILSLTPIVYLGTISYGIYLYHFFAIWGFQAAFGWTRGQYPNQALYFVVLFATSVAVASASWFAFERPLNGLKRYFPYDAVPEGPQLGRSRLAELLTNLKRSNPWVIGIGMPLLGVATFAASTVLVEVFTDRDWRLSGLEWPADFITAASLVLLAVGVYWGVRKRLNMWARQHGGPAEVAPPRRSTSSSES